MPNPKTKITFLCSECGADFPKWYGKCPACHEWGTLKEFTIPAGRREKILASRESKPLSEVLYNSKLERTSTNIPEIDRVLGGGFLPGSVVLLGGSPGIGKSTLALQIVSTLKRSTVYVSAEENEEQIALRAKRISVDSEKVTLSGENQWERIQEQLSLIKPDFLVIDSIQTIYTDSVDSFPGAIGQIRECGQRILEYCKSWKITAIIIGHVTKEGVIAGPRMLEHVVDTVLYLEGDNRHDFRILRAVKNRFGATNEVGVFEMTSTGLREVLNPSELFLSERQEGIAGSAVIPSMEGSRPILVEVQALVTNASFGNAQRNVTGFDFRRLAMLLAVLEKRVGLLMSTKDVFINIVGGMRVDEPAADLGVICAIASSLKDKSIPTNTVLVGEVGLGGELRGVSQLGRRINEAKQLRFNEIIAPSSSVRKFSEKISGIKVRGVDSVQKVFHFLF